MSRVQPNWRDYIIGFLLDLVVLFGVFFLKTRVAEFFSILGVPLAAGAACGIILGAVLIFAKKTTVLAILSAFFLAAWLVTPWHYTIVSSWLLGSGCMTWIASTALLAQMLTHVK